MAPLGKMASVQNRYVPRTEIDGMARLVMGGRMPRKTTAERNREILSAYESGSPIEQLGRRHALSLVRIREIVTEERCRRAVSPEPFYRHLRQLSRTDLIVFANAIRK